MIPTRPIVRYHGGKWMLAPWIISYFPEHRCYVEPYGGGGSVLLRKHRTYTEVYNDLDGEIVNLFRVARDHGDELAQYLRLTAFSREEFNLSYEPAEHPVTQAARTVIRSFMGFGSNAHNKKTGFRSASSRSGTTPALDWRNYPDALPLTIDRLRGVVIENRDAKKVMLDHDAPTTLHYIDPPYVLSTRGDEKADYSTEMTDADHEELASFIKTLSGMVILSGYPCPLYERLYADWLRVERTALADGAAKRTEVLWMKNVQMESPQFDFNS